MSAVSTESTYSQGVLDPIEPREVVAVFVATRASGLVRFEGPLGVGMIWMKDGEIIDALVGNLVGRTAAECLLAQGEGAYQVQRGEVRRKRAIYQPTHEFIDRASSRHAEWAVVLRDGPPLLSVLSINRELLQSEHHFMDARDVGLLKLAEQRRTVMEILDVSGLDALEAMARLTKLVRLNFARVTAKGSPALRSAELRDTNHGYSLKSEELVDPVLIHVRASR